jgi:hypothetical protein
MFKNYSIWTNVYGVELTNIDDAMAFVLLHEGFHAGTIMSLRKLVRNV